MESLERGAFRAFATELAHTVFAAVAAIGTSVVLGVG